MSSQPKAKARRGLDLSGADQRFRDRFWSKVSRGNGCWEWAANRQVAGYGQFTIRDGVPTVAHRVSFALTYGPIPPGGVVCHTCDNPPCVRPDHLFLGTQADNAADMFAKGRQGIRHHGEAKPSARLTEAEVREIRAAPAHFGVLRELSRQYGVSNTTIRKIRTGEKWSHVA